MPGGQVAVSREDGPRVAPDGFSSGLPEDVRARFGTVRAQLLTVDDGRADNDAALKAAADILDSAGAETTSTRKRGRATYVIWDALARRGESPPLVVMGTRGLTNLRRLWTGSTAAAVARHYVGNVIVASEGPGHL